jgi:RHH-type transcriptional regulator, proline utilization regulon repressor / proline dehydrogenase / delta 1-pyrroline-5-carboxylate dehydrogenase
LNGDLPAELSGLVAVEGKLDAQDCVGVLFEGVGDAICELSREVAALPGPIRPVFTVAPDALGSGIEEYPLEFLLEERSTSVNTAAAGGNASLMAMG